MEVHQRLAQAVLGTVAQRTATEVAIEELVLVVESFEVDPV
ncbi:hypothetical protein OOK39_44625 [Streptomyces sp. NBC_00264]|nr:MULTISPECIES: hypothetical protein [unclassified Streptomyces]MCX5165905.1 hypothetical protein [Streptomyces sp. NBC_00305]MCX5224650.1 hypothetical protein [Streptomyces sp. NBC_00264]